MDEHKIENADLSNYSIERLQKELTGIQMALDMLFTKNNDLDGIDITEGGGSELDQLEFQRLDAAQRNIVTEINKRHLLKEIS